jgi:hypothetical protein
MSEMSDAGGESMIPELRTSSRFAIALTAGALAALAIAVLGVDHVENAFKSSSAAVVLLGAWCLTGCGGAIAGIVDAYVRPEGETLGLATTIAATLFAVLGMLVLASLALGAMDALG